MGNTRETKFGPNDEWTLLGPLHASEMIPDWVGLGD